MHPLSASLPVEPFEVQPAAPLRVESPAAVRPAWPVAILGVAFDNVTLAEAVERIEAMIAAQKPCYVVTANVDFLAQARRDVELRRILLDADLVLCDGTPLVWASRWLGQPLPERVAGSDLAPALMQAAARKGWRVFLFGAANGVAAQAAERLQARYPNLQIVGHHTPPFHRLLEMDHKKIAQRIRAARPDILLVALGCPKQEKWIGMHFRSLGVPVVLGVGATLDFLAGRLKRAPLWMQRSGTEWLYRLRQEPRRLFRRYARDLLFFLSAIAAQWIHLRTRRMPASERYLVFMPKNWIRVALGREISARALARDAGLWQTLMAESCHCQLDLSQAQRLDSTGLAILIHWRKLLHSRQRELVLLSPSDAVKRTLHRMQLDDYFLMADDAAQACRLVEAMLDQPPVTLADAEHPLIWQGEITAANADQVWQLTTGYLNRLGTLCAALVIDVSQVRFIDSAGASLMLRIKKYANEIEMNVAFAGAQPAVRNVLELAQLDGLLRAERK